jgi:hypothetical protein
MARTTALGTKNGAAKAGAVAISYATVSNNTALTDLWFQLFDKADAPTGGDVPFLSVLVKTGTTHVLGAEAFTDEAGTLANGLAWGWSTTSASYTAPVSATATAYLVHS